MIEQGTHVAPAVAPLLLQSTMLKALAAREVPIPEHIDMYLLDREMPASDKTALQVKGAAGGALVGQCGVPGYIALRAC